MSDFNPGPGWWQASDGKWYSPQQASPPPLPPPPTADAYAAWLAAPADDDAAPAARKAADAAALNARDAYDAREVARKAAYEVAAAQAADANRPPPTPTPTSRLPPPPSFVPPPPSWMPLMPQQNTMNVGMRMEVHFHQRDQASVILESATDAEEERFGEILLVALFSARMLVNLGQRNPSAQGLAQILSQAGPHLVELARHEATDGTRLVTYQGAKGRKGFLATLKATDSNLQFNVKARIGLRGGDYYAPNAAILLIRHLTLRREDDEAFVVGLGLAAALIGNAFLEGSLNIRSQAQLALTVAMMAAAEADLLPDD